MPVVRSIKKGFTLSEILVALTLLGLLCAVVIPTILTNVGKAKNTSVLREALGLILDINTTAVSTGEYDSVSDWDVTHTGNGTIVNYVGTKLNYTKQCLVGDYTTKGCIQGYPNKSANDVTNAHSARWVLNNGVKIQAGSADPLYGLSSAAMVWVVTANAFADTTTFGEDTISFICNPTSNTTITTGWGVQSIKAGSCGGYPTGLKPLNDKALGVS